MEPERKPKVVDLARYKKSRQAQAQAQARKPPPRPHEPILGGRPRAGLILGVVLLVVIAMVLLAGPH